MEDCERLAEVELIVGEIAERAGHGAMILVEGMRDRDSLRMLGVNGRIILTSQKPLFRLAECVASERCDIIVLSDWDGRGDEVAEKTELYLRSNGVVPDGDLRRKLKALVKKDIKDVESLYGYVERLRKTCSPKPQHY